MCLLNGPAGFWQGKPLLLLEIEPSNSPHIARSCFSWDSKWLVGSRIGRDVVLQRDHHLLENLVSSSRVKTWDPWSMATDHCCPVHTQLVFYGPWWEDARGRLFGRVESAWLYFEARPKSRVTSEQLGDERGSAHQPVKQKGLLIP